MIDFVNIVVSKQQVLAGDTESIQDVLQSLIRSPAHALQWRERVAFSFDGYNDVQGELFEIEEVRNFVHQLDEKFPYWLFFLSKADFGLQCIMLCFQPPFLKPEAKARIFPERISELLEDRWIRAMNQVCEFVGMSEYEIEQMTNRVAEYLGI